LVAGSIWGSLAAGHSTAKLLLVFFPIWLFAVSGFQHVVANSILFSMGLFYMINGAEQETLLLGLNYAVNSSHFKNLDIASIKNFKEIKSWVNIGDFAFRLSLMNLLPATLGNWISGSFFLPYTYYYLSGHYKEMRKQLHNVV
ncbi:MAG: formate/nitrite transporter family protein, partial [Mycoplasmataceae bacterium]|nr:formate/nitrite transporter family protein [Mycoplasmataceae bacterium]